MRNGDSTVTYLEPLISQSHSAVPVATRRDIVRALFRHRWPIAICLVVTTAATGLAVSQIPPTYEASAKVLVQTEQQGTPTFFSGLAAYSDRRDTDPVSRRLETEMEIIEAAPISEQVVRELGLDWPQIYHSPLIHAGTAIADRAGAWLHDVFGISPVT